MTQQMREGRAAVAAAPGPARDLREALMQEAVKHRRPRGTGHLSRRTDKAGRQTWYGKFAVNGQQKMVKLGLVREPGKKYGLTEVEANRALQRAIEDALAAPPPKRKLTLEEAGKRYLEHKERLGLKPTTLSDYDSHLRVHLVPFFSGRSLDAIDADMVEAFIAAKLRDGKAPKSVCNFTGLLHAIFAFGERRGWCRSNPVALVEKPRDTRERDIRFLDVEELEALLRAVPDDELGATERALYLTAAMTGLRRGELLALRWQDVDWTVGLIRVRRNYTRGSFGTPKSRRSSRAVPLADRVARELELHFQRSPFVGDGDLVFPHPLTGGVYDPSKLQKRFKAAAARAGLRPVRFHDLRHTFGTRMAAAGAPLRMIQEWMGHSDYKTTSLYADYAPDPTQGARWAARAFGHPLEAAQSEAELDEKLER